MKVYLQLKHFVIVALFSPTAAGMGNLCCSDSTVANSDQASPKFAARANGQVASDPVVAKTTQPRPAFHSTNNGTTIVNGSTSNKQNSAPPSRQNSNSKVITVKTVTSSSKVNVSSKISTTSVDTNSTVRSGALKRDSIDNVENYVEDEIPANGSIDQYSFPPVLEDFNLMDCDIDPTVLEDLFADDK